MLPNQPNAETRIYARRDFDIGDGVALYMFVVADNGKRYQVEITYEMKPIEEGSISRPQMFLRDEQAQRLMDQLWDCGLRPTEGKGSAGALAATEAHLSDMRTFATKLLNHKLTMPEPQSHA